MCDSPNRIKTAFLLATMIALVALVACGSSATATPAPAAPAATAAAAAPQPTAVPQATVAPTAVPQETVASTAAPPTAPPALVGPTGTLNVGFKELFTFGNSPRLTESAVMVFVGSSSGEPLLKLNIDREIVPQLVTEWTLDDNGTIWTLKLREDVDFHKGWGKFTAADVVYTLQEYTVEDGVGSALGTLQRLWGQEGGGPVAVDDYTVTVDTVNPQFDFIYYLYLPPLGVIVSKKNFEAEGQEAATFQGVGTGLSISWIKAPVSSGSLKRWKTTTARPRSSPS